MAIGPIGNAIFVNQQTAAASNVQNAHNNRVEFQNMVAQTLANEKEKEVVEVRPTEENHEVDPDREHQRQEADEETKRSEHQEKDEDEEKKSEKEFPIHKLDIKV
ncbi:hypothetical protein FJR48_00630 [Sulfurimonas lithotrophica]|uniref:Uncharacterized protein n=1 Tax=Sulfurimonas lithotrophica TaxID=2590022 RepID=A0A5P8NY18_9BACT|nr:hypothetical protein [Sulfurimonas lithotrophica]QFR48307.1 hypothetical protein FJR48_00630 [Sulfurimonas lithotrophica]